MARKTKAELADALTVEQLRTLAGDKNVDLTGKSNKAEIAEAVAAGTTASDLESAQPTTTTPDTTAAPSTTTDPTTTDPLARTSESDLSQTASAQATRTAAEENDIPVATIPGNIAPNDTEALQKARLSAADLELAAPTLPGGETRIVKASPETPTARQVEASEVEQSGPPGATIELVTGKGEDNIVGRVMADDQALITQRVVATTANSPVQLAKGHGSNPNLRDMTDEEREANEEAYAARVS